MLSESGRVHLTTSCRDTDSIPKVDNAGAVLATPQGSVQVMHNGVRIVEGCYYGQWMTDVIGDLRGHHEPQEEVVFHEIVEQLAADTPRPVMLELGAFWAYYSLWMLHRVSDARAILVEPDPNNLEAGRANLALNHRQAETLQAAVGATAEPPHPFECESDGQTRLVPTESLRSILERFGVPRLDLVLLDVQGAELAFLEGARELLNDHVRFVVVSTHHHSISGDPATHQSCLRLLTDLGAHIIAEHTVAESFSGDGLIAASFDRRDDQFRVPISFARASESLFGDPIADFARAEADRHLINDQLAAAVTELEAANAATQRARADLDDALAAAAAVQGELTQIKATATWRLHQRLLRSRAGRAMLGGASRAARVVKVATRASMDTPGDAATT